MIIITSSVPLNYWYKELQFNRTETLDQLYRRISCYVVVTDKEITVYDDGIDEHGKPKGLGQVFKNELADMKTENKPKFDYKAAFGKICETPTDGEEVFTPSTEQTKIKFD